MNRMKLTKIDMQGQELDSLSLSSLIDLETKHAQAYRHIHQARSQKQEEENIAKDNKVLLLTQENQRLEVDSFCAFN